MLWQMSANPDVDRSGFSGHPVRMKHYRLATAMFLLSAAPVAAQNIPDADAERMIAELQAGHIRANVPDNADFSRLLERDLAAYFAASGVRNPVIRFELLRQGATQSGSAYPKFYLWVRACSGEDRVTAGAIRVAAVQRERFEITDFLSAKEISGDPDRIGSIFPAPLVGPIRERAGLGASCAPE